MNKLIIIITLIVFYAILSKKVNSDGSSSSDGVINVFRHFNCDKEESANGISFFWKHTYNIPNRFIFSLNPDDVDHDGNPLNNVCGVGFYKKGSGGYKGVAHCNFRRDLENANIQQVLYEKKGEELSIFDEKYTYNYDET